MAWYLDKYTESEDEHTRKGLIRYLKADMENNPSQLPTFYEGAIAYLEKQKEPNPAEWSEEDERVYDILLNEFKQLYDGRATSLSRKEVIDVYNFVKSLRPSWKPSEEQMALLRAVISDPNNAGAESCQLVLREIYQQFKKL